MSVDNYHFHYSFTGNPNQPLILFLHGFLGNCNEFARAISLLSDEFCCLVVDLPGHGKTKVTGEDVCYRMENTAKSLIHWLDSLKIEKCFLLGYSMGGRLALYLTLHFPQRFSKVILESASPGLKTQEERWKRIQSDLQLAEKLEISDFSEFLINWYAQPLFASLKNHPDFKQIQEHRLQNNPVELAKSLRNLSTGYQPSLWDNLKQNEIPLLLLVGEFDAKFKAINTEMATLCKSAHLKIVKNCGHNIHLENSREFVNCIKQFFT